MKKTLLLAGVATALFAMNANAVELNPYVGAKFRYVDMTSEYTEPGYSFDVDDKVMGGSIAIGTAVKTDN
jgi:xanthine/uracil permease